ncbi:MAG TPA: hypothetical protein VJV04_17260 [Nitrospiraceae bacterium]|nr:hypothetical protein [Nitrospiraceae bacterium]
MDLEIGSNLYRNTDGTVEIEGVPQMTIGLRKPEGPLLVNFVMFDPVGRVVMKVVDTTMAFNERRAHELEKTATRFLLKNTESGKVVISMEVKQPGRVTITQGDWITIKGHRMEILPHEWRLDKLKKVGEDIDVKGACVKLG